MSFIDERLLEKVSYGFSGGPTFATTRVQLVSGREKRNAERSNPKWRFSAPYENIPDEYISEVRNAYIACWGPVESFRFKDWTDYQLNDVVIGTAVGDTNETMQIVKPYTFGTKTVNHIITKPVDSIKYNKANGYVEDSVALSVTADDTPISFAVDYDTGILTFTVSAGEVIRVTGEFDFCVHFDEDSLDFTIANWRAHTGEIVLVEDFQ